MEISAGLPSVRLLVVTALAGFAVAGQLRNNVMLGCEFTPNFRTAYSMQCNLSGFSSAEVSYF